MRESKSVLKRLCAQDSVGVAAQLSAKDTAIARLTALVAMQADYVVHKPHCHFSAIKDCTCGLDKALSATSETVLAYQNEVKVKALEDASDMCERMAASTSDSRVKHERLFVADRISKMASELRAKGE